MCKKKKVKLINSSLKTTDQVGGPSWTVKLGRRDSTTASASLASSDLPRFTASLQSLIDLFDTKGLSERDMVALSGMYTYKLIIDYNKILINYN